MNIIVAGGAGFLGSWLCEALLSKGHHVICIDNLISGNKKNIEHLTVNTRFRLVEFDIINPIPKSVSAIFGKVDQIYHLASPASPNKKSRISYMNYPVETMLSNSVGTFNLLMVARAEKARLLFASSSEVYGEPKVHPQTEDYFGNVNPNGPRSCYDEAKRFGEAMVFSFIRKYGIKANVVRIFNTYGPRMDPGDGRVVSNFLTLALKGQPLTVFGKGTQTRSYCYVSDLINGLIMVMNSEKTVGETVNLGNDSEFSVMELIKLIEKVMKRKLVIVYEDLPVDDPTRRKPSLAKIKMLTGYKTFVSLENGIKKTIEYFREIL